MQYQYHFYQKSIPETKQKQLNFKLSNFSFFEQVTHATKSGQSRTSIQARGQLARNELSLKNGRLSTAITSTFCWNRYDVTLMQFSQELMFKGAPMLVDLTSHPNTTRSMDNCLNQTKVILRLPVEQTQALLTAKMADMKQVR